MEGGGGGGGRGKEGGGEMTGPGDLSALGGARSTRCLLSLRVSPHFNTLNVLFGVLSRSRRYKCPRLCAGQRSLLYFLTPEIKESNPSSTGERVRVLSAKTL